MKPTRNRIYCHACQRTKMLFESETKANNFIKFNKESFMEEGRFAPVRSYYCALCSGWHITSKSEEHREYMEEHDKELLDSVELLKEIQLASKGKKNVKAQEEWVQSEEGKRIIALSAQWTNELNNIEQCLKRIRLGKIDDRIAALEADFAADNNPLDTPYLKKGKKIERLNALTHWLSALRNLLSHSFTEQEEMLSTMEDKPLKEKLKCSLMNQRYLDETAAILSDMEGRLDTLTKEELTTNFKICEKKLRSLKGTGRRKLISPLHTWMNRLQGEWKRKNKTQEETVEPANDTSCEAYREDILHLINDCQAAKAALDSGNYARCEEILDLTELFLAGLALRGENAALIQSVLDGIRNELDKHFAQ